MSNQNRKSILPPPGPLRYQCGKYLIHEPGDIRDNPDAVEVFTVDGERIIQPGPVIRALIAQCESVRPLGELSQESKKLEQF